MAGEWRKRFAKVGRVKMKQVPAGDAGMESKLRGGHIPAACSG